LIRIRRGGTVIDRVRHAIAVCIRQGRHQRQGGVRICVRADGDGGAGEAHGVCAQGDADDLITIGELEIEPAGQTRRGDLVVGDQRAIGIEDAEVQLRERGRARASRNI
jgi:hypothetical protein